MFCWMVGPPYYDLMLQCLFVPKDGLTPLLLSAKHAHAEVCSTLLDCGAEINTSDNSGRLGYTQSRTHTENPDMMCNSSDVLLQTLAFWMMDRCYIGDQYLFYSVLQDSLDAGQ